MSSRESPEYAKWRKEVKKRDGRYCQWPGCRKVGKQVHHIIPYSNNMHLRIAVENGVLLCVSCHKRVKGRENDYAVMFMTVVEANSRAYAERLKRRKL